VKVTAHIELRDLDWVVTADHSKGSAAYFDRSFGNWLPGDPEAIEDVELKGDGHNGTLDYDDLTPEERAEIDDLLSEAAVEEERGAWEDEQERRADADRDDRRLGEGRYARD
jgi:hypothetical protein